MRVLVLTTDYTGHHLHFAGLLVQAVREAGLHPVLSGPQGFRDSSQYAVHVATRVKDLETREFPRGVYRTRRPLSVRSLFVDEARASRADWAFVPFADALAESSILRGPVSRILPVSGLLLRGRFAYPAGSLKKWIKHSLTRRVQSGNPLTHMWHLDPLAFESLRRSGASIGLMPEPVEAALPIERRDARRALELPEAPRIIALLGSLDRRKGVLELLRAHRQARCRDTLLLVMGQIHPAIRAEVMALAADDRTVVVREGYVDSLSFAQAMVASDWLAVPYLKHVGSSGILMRAVAYGRPVIASDWGWVGEATRRFGLGVIARCGSAESLAAVLRALPDTAPQLDSAAANRFREFNTEANFRAHWIHSLGARVSPELLPTPIRLDHGQT